MRTHNSDGCPYTLAEFRAFFRDYARHWERAIPVIVYEQEGDDRLHWECRTVEENDLDTIRRNARAMRELEIIRARRLCMIYNQLSGELITSVVRSLPYVVSLDDFNPALRLDQASVVFDAGLAPVDFAEYTFTEDCTEARVVLMPCFPRNIWARGLSWQNINSRRGWRKAYKEFAHYVEAAFPGDDFIWANVSQRRFVQLILQAYVGELRELCVLEGGTLPNHGRAFAGVFHALSRKAGITAGEAEAAVDAWLGTKPVVLEWLRDAVREKPFHTYFA